MVVEWRGIPTAANLFGKTEESYHAYAPNELADDSTDSAAASVHCPVKQEARRTCSGWQHQLRLGRISPSTRPVHRLVHITESTQFNSAKRSQKDLGGVRSWCLYQCGHSRAMVGNEHSSRAVHLKNRQAHGPRMKKPHNPVF